MAAGCQAPASVTEAHASPGSIPREMTSPFCPQALSNRGQHSISYTLSRSHSVIVEYTHDSDTDMFQVGSGASMSLPAAGPPGLDAQLCRCPGGRLADRRPGGRCLESSVQRTTLQTRKQKGGLLACHSHSKSVAGSRFTPKPGLPGYGRCTV